jgi:hypothetical protein
MNSAEMQLAVRPAADLERVLGTGIAIEDVIRTAAETPSGGGVLGGGGTVLRRPEPACATDENRRGPFAPAHGDLRTAHNAADSAP